MAVASSFNNKTLSNGLVKYRKKILKHLLRLPPNTPDICINLFLKDYQTIILDCLLTTIKKIQEREMDVQNQFHTENTIMQSNLSQSICPKTYNYYLNLLWLNVQIIKQDVLINMYCKLIFFSPKKM